MKWTVRTPRAVAEDDPRQAVVDADTIEEAIIKAQREFDGTQPSPGETYLVSARVEVARRTALPLRSV